MTWIKELSPTTTWGLDRSGSSTRRITEAGVVRVTEQGVIRIIDRFGVTWTNETTTVNPWTKE